MRIRKDGEQTRRKILATALQVFGEKGFHDATHAEICRRAGANTAAINYHFGSKDGLYQAAWEHAIEQMDELHPVDGGVGEDAPATERLRGKIRALLHRFTDPRLGHFHSIRMMEMLNPTGLLDEVFAKKLASYREHLRGILRALLGPEATDDDIELCELSVISQCHAVRVGTHHKGHGPPWRFTAADVDRLAEHITRFSLAGIEASRASITQREV